VRLDPTGPGRVMRASAALFQAQVGWNNIRTNSSCDGDKGRVSVVKRESKGLVKSVEVSGMCRNIKTLFNFDPPVTHPAVKNASPFVGKSADQQAVERHMKPHSAAVDEIAAVSSRFLIRSKRTRHEDRKRSDKSEKLAPRPVRRLSLVGFA